MNGYGIDYGLLKWAWSEYIGVSTDYEYKQEKDELSPSPPLFKIPAIPRKVRSGKRDDSPPLDPARLIQVEVRLFSGTPGVDSIDLRRETAIKWRTKDAVGTDLLGRDALLKSTTNGHSTCRPRRKRRRSYTSQKIVRAGTLNNCENSSNYEKEIAHWSRNGSSETELPQQSQFESILEQKKDKGLSPMSCFDCLLVFDDPLMEALHHSLHRRPHPFACHCGLVYKDRIHFNTHLVSAPH